MNKKIIIFSPYYYPHIGGLEVYARELNKYLVSQGYSLTLVASNIPQTKLSENIEGVDIIRIPSIEIIPNFPFPKFWTKEYGVISRKLLNQDFDIVFSHTRFFISSLHALWFAKSKKLKWVHIEHGSDFVKLNNKLFSFIAWVYDQTFGRLILTQSDRNVVVSNAVRNFVLKFDKRKSDVINFGLNKDDRLFNYKKTNNKVPKVIFLGRLIDGKGVDLLIKAAKDINKKAKAEYIIVGDGPQRENLENLVINLGLKESFSFLGQKDRESGIKILQESDIFVLPSYTEGLSVTMLEAAFCKKAIISTDVGGAPEVIDHDSDGILIKPGDIGALASALEELINNSRKRDEFSKNVYNSAVKKFSWGASFGKYVKIIEGEK